MNSTIIGKVLDNYRILQNIGRGGMGFVFKALNIKLNKIVAIKMIAPGLAMNDSFMSRFESEAKTLAKLENPNIVGIHDLRIDSVYAYIVMEYVEGVTLGRLIKERGAIPWRQALKLFNQMLNAIEHAHKEGIIHRDIKPNNVLINRQGVVKITDFGLAKNQAEFGITQSVTTGGTLFYMSPEQVKGLAYTDERSDIYALGFTLYEMLTGATPFSTDHTDFDIREAIIKTKFPPPHQINQKIPAKLGRIVDQALSKKPEDRFQNVTEFKTAIEAFIKHEDDIRKRAQEAESLKNGKTGSNGNGSVSSYLDKVISAKGRNGKGHKSESAKFSRNIIYYSVAASVLLLVILKLTGFLDDPSHNMTSEGLISVTSIPNHAMVFVNGDSIGQTPIDKYQVESSSANILIIKDNYFSIDTLLNIESKEPIRIEAQLQPVARLSFEISPDDASLYINDNPIPKESWSKVLMPVGNHQIELQHEGYETYYGEVRAEQGLNNPIKINLTEEGVFKAENAPVFRINSIPSGASVYLNDKYVGKTPYQSSSLKERFYALRMSKAGYRDITDRFNVTAGESGQISKRLVALTGSIAVKSDPPGAEIYLAGKSIKRFTPYTLTEVKSGKKTITLKKDGYAEYSTDVDVKTGNTQNIDVALKQLFGNLTVLAVPWGNIYVDDQLVFKEAQIKKEMELGAGNHQVRIEHPTLGIYEKLIRVEPEKITEVTVDFNKKHSLRIVAKDPQGTDIYADVLVDGKSTGETTPTNIRLATGTYMISVSRNGYILADGPKKVTIDGSISNPLKFTLQKTAQ
ncbi:MAG: serine/threonine protein kinase [Calditrichaceae bacterium]